MSVQYRGPRQPFPFLFHITMAEVLRREKATAIRREKRQPRTYDPDWETLRPKLDRSNKRFARAMKALERGEGKRA